MSKIYNLIAKKNKYEGYKDTLQIYRPRFQVLQSDYQQIATHTKSVFDAVSFWKGPKYNDFKDLASQMEEAESKYLKSFDALDNSISSRIDELSGQIGDLRTEIFMLQRT